MQIVCPEQPGRASIVDNIRESIRRRRVQNLRKGGARVPYIVLHAGMASLERRRLRRQLRVEAFDDGFE